MLSVEQCRAGRALLDWSAERLAEVAGIGVATVRRFESGQAVNAGSIEKMADALRLVGVVLLDDGDVSAGGGRGVRLAGPG